MILKQKFENYTIPTTVNVSTRTKDYVSFGDRNDFPQMAREIAKGSPIQNAIISKLETYVEGYGLQYSEHLYSPNIHESWDELWHKLCADVALYEAFAIQISVTKDNQYRFFHIPVEQVRIASPDEYGNYDKFVLSRNWRRTSKNMQVVVKRWGTEAPKQGEDYILYCPIQSSGEQYYHIPTWFSCANACVADAEIQKYWANYAKNGFVSNIAISYPSDVDDEKKQEISDNLSMSFTGSDNAGNIILLFGSEGQRPEIKSLDIQGADLYNAVSEKITNTIITANSLTSPILAGIQVPNGFSSQLDQLIGHYTLYYISTIGKLQRHILKTLNNLARLNGHKANFEVIQIDLKKELTGVEGSQEDKMNETLDNNENNAE